MITRTRRYLCAFTLIGGLSLVAVPGVRGQGIPREFQAPGAPIVNCLGERQVMQQLQSGLPQMNEWIARTEAQLADADRGAAAARSQLTDMAQKALISKAKSYAESQMRSVKMLRARVEALRDAKLTRAERRQWLEEMKTLEDLAKKTQDLVNKAASAGPGPVDHMMNLKKQIEQNAVGFNEFARWLDTSGIGSTVATELSKGIHPVLGPIVVEGLQIATEVGIVAAGGLISAAEADQASRNLNNMRNARSFVQAKIDSHMDVLGRPPCTPTTQAATQDSTQLVRAEPEMVEPAPEKGGGASTAVTIATVAGGAAATAWGLNELKKAQDLIGTTGGNNNNNNNNNNTSVTRFNGTYRATASRACSPGGALNPCGQAVATPTCNPTNFTFTVSNGVVGNSCGWLSGTVTSSGAFNGRYEGSAPSIVVNGTLPSSGTTTMSGSAVSSGNNYTVSLQITKQ